MRTRVLRRYLGNYLMEVQSAITMGDPDAADELPELHATCSGLKAYCTVNGAHHHHHRRHHHR